MARVNGTLTGTTLAAGPPVTQPPPYAAEDRPGYAADTELQFIASHTTLYDPTVAYGGTAQSVISVAGTYQWLCPPDVTQIYVECFGGGGGGYGDTSGNAGYGAGGGGAFAARAAVPVTPGTLYTFTVGAGGTSPNGSPGADGGDSSFTGDSSTQVLAKGGIHSGQTTGGAGGAAASSVGDVGHVFSGGKGGDGRPSAPSNGGGGGASGNRVATGAAGSGGGGSTAGGVGANGGGSGGNGADVAPTAAQAGFSPGGGGGGGSSSSTVRRGAVGADGEVTISCGVVCPFIGSVTQVYTPTLPVPLSFIASTTSVYTPTLQANLPVPFIASLSTVYALQLPTIPMPFIGSSTVVYAPTLPQPELDAPFISSHTHVWSIMSMFDPNKTYGGPGNGGEAFGIRLNANGVTDTATLASGISATAINLSLTGDSAFPTTKPFVVTIDDEVLLIFWVGPGSYRIRLRGLSNTVAVSHSSGAGAAWGDSYDQAIVAGSTIAHNFTADITASGSYTYDGWLISFDASQAYLGTDRYPMHVTEVLGVFDAGAGVSGSNRCDSDQPAAIYTPTTVSDDCPAALSNPALITSDIHIGDVAVVRYKNPEAAVLDLGPRAVALQSWFGLKRVDATDHDVTLTDPDGYVVDTIPSGGGPGPFTGSVNDEWGDPVPLIPGIAPDASDLAGSPVPTPNDVPYTSVTLPGSDRYFTDSSHYSEKGWPMACLTVRQGPKRVPRWQSWDWHDYAYVYTGFGTDACFAQILINRNGIVFGSVPEVDLPGPQDIDGPDAVWDDPDYFVGASWYVVLFGGPYIVQGPTVGGTSTGPGGGGGGGGFTPGVSFDPGGSPTIVPEPPIEGGSGGDINPTLAGLHVWQTS